MSHLPLSFVGELACNTLHRAHASDSLICGSKGRLETIGYIDLYKMLPSFGTSFLYLPGLYDIPMIRFCSLNLC